MTLGNSVNLLLILLSSLNEIRLKNLVSDLIMVRSDKIAEKNRPNNSPITKIPIKVKLIPIAIFEATKKEP